MGKFQKIFMVMIKCNILIFFCFILIFGCKNNRTTLENEIIQRYNSEIYSAKKENKEWVNSPVTIVMKLLSSNLSDETNINLLKLNEGERATKVKIVFKEKGETSESDFDEEDIIFMSEIEGVWQFENPK
jgi:hypothetical protein